MVGDALIGQKIHSHPPTLSYIYTYLRSFSLIEKRNKKEKMGEKKVRLVLILMACLVMGLIVGQAQASFKSCYESCFLICLITPNTSAFSCSFKCLKDCIIRPSLTQTSPTSLHTNNNKLYFCKLGCASSLCTNLSSKHDPSKSYIQISFLPLFNC